VAAEEANESEELVLTARFPDVPANAFVNTQIILLQYVDPEDSQVKLTGRWNSDVHNSTLVGLLVMAAVGIAIGRFGPAD